MSEAARNAARELAGFEPEFTDEFLTVATLSVLIDIVVRENKTDAAANTREARFWRVVREQLESLSA